MIVTMIPWIVITLEPQNQLRNQNSTPRYHHIHVDYSQRESHPAFDHSYNVCDQMPTTRSVHPRLDELSTLMQKHKQSDYPRIWVLSSHVWWVHDE